MCLVIVWAVAECFKRYRQVESMTDGNDNFALAPGLTAVHPQFKRFANFSKVQYAYHHNDAVANSLLAEQDDRHHVFYDEADPLKAHLFLDKLASD